MSLLDNLRTRFDLIRIALTQRYVWGELVDLSLKHGYTTREIRADTHPLDFVRGLSLPNPPKVDYSSLGPSSSFILADAFAWNSEPSVGRFLGDLVLCTQARVVVELGCFVGWSSAHMALAARQLEVPAQLWCVDCRRDFLEATRTNLERRKLGTSVNYLQGMSLDTPVLEKLPREIDLLFIDTSHEYKDTLEEVRAYSRRLSAKGVIVLHDAISQPGVRRFASECVGDYAVTTFATEEGNGVTVLRRPAT